MPIDEGPSDDDLERFSGETAYCPHCGAEIWDQAEFCPECRQAIGNDLLSRPPVEAWVHRRWYVAVALIVLAALLLLILRGL
jgi:hypothetical protein